MGLCLLFIYSISFFKWIRNLDKTIYLTKLSLTLIPSDSLNE